MQGVISKINLLGLYFKTNKGLHLISYYQLYTEGYTIISGQEIGGFYQLKIVPSEPGNKTNIQVLMDLFATAPYIDHNHTTEILSSTETEGQFNAKVLVREEHHLSELISLIQEWGFLCKISKK